MNIKKSDWHYRILSPEKQDKVSMNSERNRLSLCWYFWQVVGELVKVTFAIFIAAFLLMGAGFFIFNVAYIWAFTVDYLITGASTFSYDLELLTVSVATNFMGFAFAFVYYLFDNIKSLWKMIKHRTPTQPKQHGIVLSYIKAKKQKICPMIKLCN